MASIGRIYTCYGKMEGMGGRAPGQGRIHVYKQGEAFLAKSYPELTRITGCMRVGEESTARRAALVEFGVL